MNPNMTTHADLCAEVAILKAQLSGSNTLDSEVRNARKAIEQTTEALTKKIDDLQDEVTTLRVKLAEQRQHLSNQINASAHNTGKAILSAVADTILSQDEALKKSLQQRVTDTLGQIHTEVSTAKATAAASAQVAADILIARAAYLAKGE